MNFTYQQGDKSYTIRLEQQSDGRFTAVIADRVYPVEAVPLTDGGWLIDWGSGRTVSYSAAHGPQRYVHADDHTHTVTIPDGQISRQRTTSSSGDLTAEMPGQVVDVLVEAGSVVTRGQPLVILEAMKMEMRVRAPHDGTVRSVLVTRGDVIERGQRLVEIDALA